MFMIQVLVGIVLMAHFSDLSSLKIIVNVAQLFSTIIIRNKQTFFFNWILMAELNFQSEGTKTKYQPIHPKIQYKLLSSA